MGQQDVSTSDNATIKVTQLPKLASDGENWLTYHERVLNAATAHGLRRHLVGTALQPSPIIEKDGKFYLSATDVTPLTDEALEEHETSVDTWEQKEAQVRELIYNTVDSSSFLQIKGEKTVAALWKKLTSIHGNKDAQFEEYLLGKLQTACYAENEDMCTHLTTMNTLRERLSEIGSPISDVQFNAYIRTSLFLTTRYQPTLSTTARQTKTALSSDDLIWHLVEEANTIKLEANINKAHAALAIAHGKANKLKGHTHDNCFAKGGGKEHEAPDWWKQKQEAKSKSKETKKETANGLPQAHRHAKTMLISQSAPQI